MAIPYSINELQKAITYNYGKLTAELMSIPFEKTNKKELEGQAKNNTMSINNLLTYLLGWGLLVLK